MEDRIERLRLRSRRLQATATAISDRYRQTSSRRSVSEDDEQADFCPYHIEEGGDSTVGVSAPTPPPFTVTAESGVDESDENDTLPSAAVMADRLRRDSRWRSESVPDPGEVDPNDLGPDARGPRGLRRAHPLEPPGPPSEWRGWRGWRNQRSIDPIRAARLHTPSRIEPGQRDPDANGLIAPHARFFIARHKNKITIRFTPAISGKYILLKLWSPTRGGNIDIESVQFYGYSGPRFFPAVKPC